MRKLFPHWWHAALAGLIVGVPAGIALEFARRASNKAALRDVARQFESNGMSPPLITDMLAPWVVPTLTSIIFLLFALSIYAFVAYRRRVSHSDRQMTKLLSTISILLLVGVAARGQQTSTITLSDAHKASIIESVLDAELQNQNSVPDFANIRRVSSDNIELVEPSQLSKHGFMLVAGNELRQSKKDRIVEYLLFRKILWREGMAVVTLARVTEGRPCFGNPISIERTYTYESRQTSRGWVTELTRRPMPPISLAPKRSHQLSLNPNQSTETGTFNRTITTSDKVSIDFIGTVKSIEPLGKQELRVIPVDFDSRFTVTIHIESVTPREAPLEAGTDQVFAVHSPARLFRVVEADIIGTKYRFRVT